MKVYLDLTVVWTRIIVLKLILHIKWMDYTTGYHEHVYFMYRKSVVTLLENIWGNVALKQLDKPF